LSAAIVQAPNYFLLHLHAFESIWFLFERLQKWTVIHLPDARTSHLRTLSKIVGIGLSASSLLSLSVSAEAPDRAAHYRVVFVTVNTLLRFFFSRRRTEVAAEKVLHSGWFRLIRQHLLFCFDPHHLKLVKTLSCGPRIIGKYQNPSTPQRFNLSFVSARFRSLHSGRAL
jgi:hypothetical protein